MEVSYTHANPRRGQESYYIKFDDSVDGQTMCILVDSGRDVSVRQDLAEDEYLGGILLTHAHGDHYATLPSNIVDGASVYTSPDTARVLETILDETGKHNDIGDSDRVTDALTPITDWTTLWGSVEVRPIPAGHCPGAVGFLIRFEADGKTNHILATGDFTFDSVAGNPGMPMSLPVEVDAMFMNASVTTSEESTFPETLTESIDTILDRALAGSRTLVSASGLAGVHYAYLLGHAADHAGRTHDIVIAGHLAKLYDDLEYDVPGVRSVPEFGDVDSLLSKGGICIAGPCVPANNASGRIFEEAIKDDPGASLVQVVSGSSYDPVESAACSVYAFDYKAHPTQSELDEFIEEILPRELIIEHGRTTMYGDRYNHTITWSNRDYDEYLLYDDGYWRSPHWINGDVDESIRASHHRKQKERLDNIGGDDDDFPTIDRRAMADFEAEGVGDEAIPSPISPTAPDEGAAEAAVETDGGATAAVDEPDVAPDPSPPDEPEETGEDAGDLARIEQRIAEIQEQLDGPEAIGEVAEMPDGDIVIQFDPEDVPELEHGDSVKVAFPDADDGEDGDE